MFYVTGMDQEPGDVMTSSSVLQINILMDMNSEEKGFAASYDLVDKGERTAGGQGNSWGSGEQLGVRGTAGLVLGIGWEM